ncbi:MAG: hypothetical protein KGY69_17430 [Bacteroidales bacterium]|nr:hypothetical protein [Bacteroidales bacterium]
MSKKESEVKCPYCGVEFDKALEKMPIPVEDCESGFCQCGYTTELLR